MIHLVLLSQRISTDSVIIAVVGYLVVFVSLVMLYWFFNTLPKVLHARLRKKRNKAAEIQQDLDKKDITGEEIAAISLALHLHLSEAHDEESGVLTIKKVSKVYSPWSSKIYAVRNQFNRI